MADAYKFFFKNFGSAYRTEHVRLQWANPVLRIFGKGPKRTIRAVQHNNRPYHIPWRGALPKGFIRLDPWEGQYLFLIASMAKHGILEIGRFNGGSVFLMACANLAIPIYSIDIAPVDDARLREIFRAQGVGGNVKLIVGDSQRERSPEVGSFDVLFVDGDHSYDGCTRDLENWFPVLERGGHILLHDSYQGSEVQQAVIDFLGHHKVRVIVPPYIPTQHWHLPLGSIAHLTKDEPI